MISYDDYMKKLPPERQARITEMGTKLIRKLSGMKKTGPEGGILWAAGRTMTASATMKLWIGWKH